ncbi:MAG TPA: protein kinase [Verrucomicrobiae bacterium]|nr:protein kinase [Verrucomicrobiae bacterium]
MMLSAGAKLGPYEILSAIGAGGMGEVYRARDTRLDRTVAIKVLPAHLAGSAALRERFEREAKTIASLNHPHICTLYDTGHQDEIDFLVMEYLEGETLAQRLLKGSLPIQQVLQYAIEISDALDKAHRKGITHRDLKPGNIMLTKSGTKLVDFGLAKLAQEATPATPESQLPTMKSGITGEGTILGTLQYMAPEQVEGTAVDGRTDIFAFGAVVYEMATGKKAFTGKSHASLIAAILERDPPAMTTLQPMTPPALDRVVKKCLAKEPEKRWQAASDVCDELKWIAEGGSQTGMPALAVASRKSPLADARLAWLVAAILFLAVLSFGSFAYFKRPPEQARAVRFTLFPPDKWSLAGQGAVTTGATAPVMISPDGRQIAFVAVSAEGKTLLWVRSLDTLAAQALTGTEGASAPFWSPDGRTLGFFAGGKLKKIDVSGGPPITLCDAPDNRGGTWNRDGLIVFAPTNTSVLQKVSASGGVPAPATVLGQGEFGHIRPSFLPDGRHFLYSTIAPRPGLGGPIYLGSLDLAERKALFNANSANALFTQGYLLFLRETTLIAQPFDARRLVSAGDAFPIAERIRTSTSTQPYAYFSASENGALVYQTGAETANSQLLWFDRTGKQIGELGDPAAYSALELSPDGKRASVSIADEAGKGQDIWLYDVARGLRTRFTFGPGNTSASLWSPDGSRIVFNSRRKGSFDLYQKASSGAGSEETLLQDNLDKYPDSWSPDGKFVLYENLSSSRSSELFVLPLSGDRKPFPLLQTQFGETDGQISPDGRWVAYRSNESGRNEIYVAPFPGPGGKWQISTAGGYFPRWRHDGSEIFYLTPDNRLMAASINGKGAGFEVGAVKPLFATRIVGGGIYQYDVSADGQRFLINTAPEQATSAPITVVLNWTAELKK